MNLRTLVQSLRREEVLLPKLRSFLKDECLRLRQGRLGIDDIIVEDANLAIKCFQERKKCRLLTNRVKGLFHPSQLSACLRSLWFSDKAAPMNLPVDGETLFKEWITFELGTYVHVMFQNLCERAGVLVEREVLIEDRVNQIGGHADGILELNKTKFVLEIKTINSRGFTSLDTAPMESHRNQVMAYMKSLNLPLACIVYLDKDHSVAKEYTVKFNSQTYDQKVATKIKAYFAFLSQRVPPPKEGVSPQSQVCKYCPYTQICFSTEHLKGFLQKL